MDEWVTLSPRHLFIPVGFWFLLLVVFLWLLLLGVGGFSFGVGVLRFSCLQEHGYKVLQ
jgi:hypothetical protein